MYILKINNHSKKLLFIFLLGFFIRLIGLNQSLWLDEAVTANVVKYNSLFSILKNFSPYDFHPPLYYLFLKLWSVIFGYSEVALRFPSLLFSLATGLVIYQIGRLLQKQSLGFWAGIFFLLNPLAVYYSQEVRMYMMATFLITTSFYFLLKKKMAFFTFFSVLSFYTFYGSLFFIVTSTFYLWYKKQHKSFLFFIFYILFFIFLISPLLYSQWMNAQRQLMIVSNWRIVLGAASVKNLLLIPLKFSFGRMSFYPKPFYYLIAGIWTLLVFYFAFAGGIRNKKIVFFFVMPLLIGLIVSLLTPLLQYFRFLYLLPFLSILLAYGVQKNWQRMLLFLGLSLLSLISLLNPSFHREDWKSLAIDVVKYKKVYMIYTSSDPIKYYRSDMSVKDVTELSKTKDEKIIVIPYSADIYGVDYRKILDDNNYERARMKSFRGVTIEYWQKETIIVK